ncbi:MAG: hypothetical protein Q4B70_06955 [Lachnospiraceae bacterium]|nr:hypothetical protein [Lachnospiraceae bacterium]
MKECPQCHYQQPEREERNVTDCPQCHYQQEAAPAKTEECPSCFYQAKNN